MSNSDRQPIPSLSAAELIQKHVGGQVWNKKAGESRLYVGSGYIRFAVATGKLDQVSYHCKSYEITPEIETAVEKLNAKFFVVDSESTAKGIRANTSPCSDRDVIDAQQDVARDDNDI